MVRCGQKFAGREDTLDREAWRASKEFFEVSTETGANFLSTEELAEERKRIKLNGTVGLNK